MEGEVPLQNPDQARDLVGLRVGGGLHGRLRVNAGLAKVLTAVVNQGV